ncbi:MAG TPA: hypothetical protein VLQ46_11915, partial [Casimicrobiaceae bacterium]|nr:hypothetical protein [Casimicrobiaceae bacterium]
DEGRNVAAAITSLMTGRAYRQSALIAAGATGPYEEYEKNREAHNGVMRMHRDASYDIDPTGIKGDLLVRRARFPASVPRSAASRRRSDATCTRCRCCTRRSS